jgi:hypothetical protein
MDGLATHELGLVRVLGLVCLVPVVDALSDPSPGRLTAAALGVLALAAHLLSLSGHAWAGHRIAPLGLAAVTLACGLVAHAIGGHAWALIALAGCELVVTTWRCWTSSYPVVPVSMSSARSATSDWLSGASSSPRSRGRGTCAAPWTTGRLGSS